MSTDDGVRGGLLGPTTPEVNRSPQPFYKVLRDACPVVRMDGRVVVSRRADIDAALRRPGAFSSDMAAVELGNLRPLIPLQIDPPDHAKFRRLLDPLFSPRQVNALEGDIVKLVHQLIDGFAARGECDISAELAVPLPSQVFLTLLGLPLDDLPALLRLKDGILHPAEALGVSPDSEEARRYQAETGASVYEYFEALLEERRDDRPDDLLSRLIDAEVDGDRLTTEEIVDICFLLLIAGLDTVTACLECFFAHLAQNPEQRAQLAGDPSLIPEAVEELLRWETPVMGIARIAVHDVELGGETIAQGEQVALLLGSANTDEAAFDRADQVDLARTVNRHLAFGGGVHRCLGSHLARLELRVALREFHQRIPDYQLRPGVELEYTSTIRSIGSLPLVFPASR